ncbi:MAG: MoaD/ThiS family protein [Dehalococcoidia bacterium]|nr:MoaD/ThiS family protein [Dehalococcoidia bacterium]
MATVNIKTSSMMQSLLGLPKTLEAHGDTVHQALEDIKRRYPKLEDILSDSSSQQSPPTLILLNNKDIRLLKGLDTLINEGDILMLIYAAIGG